MNTLSNILSDSGVVRSVIVFIFSLGTVWIVTSQTPIPDWYKDLMLVVLGGYFGSLVPTKVMLKENGEIKA